MSDAGRRMTGEAADVQLVNDRIFQRDQGGYVVVPVKGSAEEHAAALRAERRRGSRIEDRGSRIERRETCGHFSNLDPHFLIFEFRSSALLLQSCALDLRSSCLDPGCLILNGRTPDGAVGEGGRGGIEQDDARVEAM